MPKNERVSTQSLEITSVSLTLQFWMNRRWILNKFNDTVIVSKQILHIEFNRNVTNEDLCLCFASAVSRTDVQW
jgi:hypothetical protein